MVESDKGRIGLESREKDMESRKFSLIFIGPPTSGKSTFTTYFEETLHLPVINASMVVDPEYIPGDGSLIDDAFFISSLQKRLSSEPPTGHIFDGIPRTANQVQILAEWSIGHGFPLHIIDLDLSREEVLNRTLNRELCSKCRESYHHKVKPPKNPGRCDVDGNSLIRRSDDNINVVNRRLDLFHQERNDILTAFGNLGLKVHSIDANGPIKATARKIFQELSPLSFEDPQLSQKYFEMKDFCEASHINFMLISGACGYIYRGRRPLKDLDILVPSLTDLETIARNVDGKIELIKSSYAISRYLNYSSGVELVTDLSIRYIEEGQVKEIKFAFADLDKDSKIVRFMGENCKIMSPEWLIVLKLCMGRSGKDDYGHNKNDYADAYDVTVSQPIDYERIKAMARQIGAEKRVEEGLTILQSSAY